MTRKNVISIKFNFVALLKAVFIVNVLQLCLMFVQNDDPPI
jgi:hypothetical protein